MSVSYDTDATLDDATWVAVLLSERDVAGQIPINFVTNPGVSLSSACFGSGLYARENGAECISNLLAVGFRRLVLDLYWSVERRTWTFCPVTIPARADVMVSEVTTTTEGPSATSTLTSIRSASTTTDAEPGTITGYSDSHGDTVYELGPYRCTDNLDIVSLSEVLVGYFEDTKSDLLVYTNFLVLNLHVAASDSTPTKPAAAVTGADLPRSRSERVGALLNDYLRDYLYSPAQLAEDRSNLNESWYEVEESYMPITEYYTIHEDETGQQSTPDGWPSAKYIQLAKSDRILIEYGSVDPQLADYDLTEDEDAIFPPGYMNSAIKVSATSDGNLTSGCVYNPEATAVSQANTSWAVSSQIPVPEGLSVDSTMGSITNVISDITACGISPMLNTTLFGKTADDDVSHYRNVSLSTGWAWAVGEPAGAATGGGTSDQPEFNRCAIMDLSLQGHWRATNCSEERRAACRVGNSPFSWALSNYTVEFDDVGNGCPSGSSFAVPRTGLENHYLYEYLLTQDQSVIDPASTNLSRREVYINFNSMDITSCWVSGGPGATCPYAANPQQLERKTVLVAVVAGIVILILTALTIFVKCNANRRNSRRRKRVIEGWEYEGVPS
ncbi:hypothetical protein N7532_000769 [Penicillium argentinense]|uniref:Maintenance of telomere capping protein 6 n=1 Tax=Penicillium argentinense TaxID=1131581 RepID=A0A9W9KMY1_9EURO|nr:uncharacterized protein N7532_000769 [Penicillium argentinense]KAJ5112724.1 hypothetical protein N7532_000769 [Penicillium argentinense]